MSRRPTLGRSVAFGMTALLAATVAAPVMAQSLEAAPMPTARRAIRL